MDNRGVEISGNWKGAFSRVRISKLLVYLLIAPLFTFIQGVVGPIEKASASNSVLSSIGTCSSYAYPVSNSGVSYATRITAGSTTSITSIDIDFQSPSAAVLPYTSVLVYADSNGSMSGTPSEFTYSSVSGNAATYVGSHAVTAGSKYWIKTKNTSASSVSWFYCATTYSGDAGWYFTKNASGSFEWMETYAGQLNYYAFSRGDHISIGIHAGVGLETPANQTGTTGTSFSSLTLNTSGATGAKTFSVSSGSLPLGLSLNTSTGVISGTPTFAGTYTASFSVSDSGTNTSATTGSVTFTISGSSGLSLLFRTNDGNATSASTYFGDSSLTAGTVCHSTNVSTMDLNYPTGSSPGGSCGTDDITAYARGSITAPVTGTVTFCSFNDDGMKVVVNGLTLINDTTDHGTVSPCNYTGTMYMHSGTQYPIEMWGHNGGGPGQMTLKWSYSGQSTIIVPNSYLSTTFPSTVAPTVTNVTSSTANGNYYYGDSISIQVTFTDNVTVTGTPTLQLETGAADTSATYTSGSGTNELTFTYTVAATDISSDLNYKATNSLSGTIKSPGGIDATLTLPGLAASGSLATNKAFVVDGSSPTISGVNSSTANGTYKVGDSVSIQVTFTSAVTVVTSGGTPTLTLETGSTDRTATYASGSGTNSLTFTYTVQSGDISSDLDYTSTSALALNGGTIKNSGAVNAVLTLPSPGASGSMGANKALIIDGYPPTISSSSPSDNGTGFLANANITITFSETVSFGSGNIKLYKLDGTLIETFNVATSSAVSISTTTLTINPTNNLASNTGYYINIDSTAIKDSQNNYFAGISDTTTLNFTTYVTPVPSISAQPSNYSKTVGQSVTFSVTASASSPVSLTYQWQKNGSNISGATSTSYTISSIASGDAGTYQVVISNTYQGGIASTTSLDSNGILTIVGAPSVPQNVTFTNSGLSAGQLKLNWDAPSSNGGSSITSYEYRYSLNAEESWSAWTSIDTRTVTISGLGNQKSYKAQVRAKNAYGTSASAATSAAVSTTGDVATALGAPTISSVVNGDSTTGGKLTVSFADPSGNSGVNAITSYQYSTDSGVSWKTISVTPGATSFTITTLSGSTSNLVNGTSYTIQLRVVNAAGPGTASTGVAGIPSKTPGVPTAVSLSLGATAGTMSLAFTAPTDNGGLSLTYEFRYKLSTSSDFGAWTAGGSSSPITISGITNGNTYDVQVRAKNSTGAGTNADTVSLNAVLATGPTITTQPTNLTLTVGQTTGTTLSVTATAGAGETLSYQWQKSTDGGTTWSDISSATNSTYTVTSSAIVGDAAKFRVKVTGSKSGASSNVSAKINAWGPDNSICNAPNYNTFYYGNRFYAGTSDTVKEFQLQVPANSNATAIAGMKIRFYTYDSTTKMFFPTTWSGVNASDLPATTLGDLTYASYSDRTITFRGNVTLPSAGNYWWVVVNTSTTNVSFCNSNNAETTTDGWYLFKESTSWVWFGNFRKNIEYGKFAWSTHPNFRLYSATTTTTSSATSTSSVSTVTVNAAPSITTSTVPGATKGSAYSSTLAVSGGTGPYTWVLATGSTLPAGLSLSSSGVISGTPTALSATVASSSSSSSSTLKNGDFSAGFVSAPAANTASGGWYSAVRVGGLTTINTVGKNLQFSYGSPACTTQATVPMSEVRQTVLIPTAGTVTFKVKVKNDTWNRIGFGYSNPCYDPYQVKIVSSGGQSADTGRRIPTSTTGLYVNENVELSITTTSANQLLTISLFGLDAGYWAGNYGPIFSEASLTTPDSASSVSSSSATSGSTTFTVEVTDANGIKTTKTLTFSVASDISITTKTLGNANKGSSYSQTITASGGSGSLTFALASGTLPTGLTLNSSTGVISGTVSSTATSQSVTISATDANSASVSQSYTINVLSGVPGAPTSLTLGTIGNGTIPITWTAPTDNGGSAITNYIVSYAAGKGKADDQEDGDDQDEDKGSVSVSATGLTFPYSLTGLKNGRTYTITVSAKNANATSVASNSVSAMPAKTAGAPQALSLILSNGGITVRWKKPSDSGGLKVDSYQVQCRLSTDADTDANWKSITARQDKNSENVNSVIVTSSSEITLVKNSSYHCRVRQVSTKNGTTYNGAWATSTNPVAFISVPSAPTITAVDTSTATTKVKVTFSQSTDDGGASITSYIASINKKKDNGEEEDEKRTCNVNKPNSGWTSGNKDCTINGVPTKGNFTVTLVAVNSAGQSVADSQTVTILGKTQVLTYPANSAGVYNSGSRTYTKYIGDSDFSIGVTSNSGLKLKYTIDNNELCTITGKGLIKIKKVGLCKITITQSGKADDDDDDDSNNKTDSDWEPISGSSEYVYVNILGTTPSVPSWVSVTPGDGQLVAKYNAPRAPNNTVTNYKIEYSTSNTGGWQTFSHSDTTTTTMTVTGLTNGTAYYLKLTAENNGSSSTAVITSGSFKPAGVPTKPVISSATAYSDTSTVLIQWTATADNGAAVTSYTVTGTATGQSNVTCTTGGSATSCLITGVKNKNTYSFTLVAKNSSGDSSASDAVTAEIAGISQTISLSTTPASTGWNVGDPDLQLNASSSSGLPLQYTSSTTSICTISNGGLIHFVSDGTCSILIKQDGTNTNNPSGGGAATRYSAATNYGPIELVVSPAKPSAPRITSVTNSASGLIVVWAAPTSGGGTMTYQITGTATGKSNETCSTSDPTRTCTIAVASKGTQYAFTAVANNGVDSSTASAVVYGTWQVAPSAPTSSGTSSGASTTDGKAINVYWSKSSDDGGSTILRYTVSAVGSSTKTCQVSRTSDLDTNGYSCTITGLTPGTSYTVTVTATNSIGTSSALSIGSLTPGRSQVITVSSGTSINKTYGDADFQISATVDSGQTPTFTATGSGCSVSTTGLVHILAVNSCSIAVSQSGGGTSEFLAATPVTVTVTIGYANPSKAIITKAAPSSQSIILAWTAPSFTGGSAVTYVANAVNGGVTKSCSTDSLGCTISGLTDNTNYTITVVATNSGTLSSTSDSVVVAPYTNARAPMPLTATGGNKSTTHTWSAPTEYSGNLHHYTVYYRIAGSSTAFTAGITTSDTATVSGTISGLADNTRYEFYATASVIDTTTATISEGNATSYVFATTLDVPSAPQGVNGSSTYVASGNTSTAAISWTAPSSNGGSAITGYTVNATSSGGSGTCTTSGTTCNITGLTPGTAYSVTVIATNAVGNSSPSSALSITTVAPAAAPTSPSASGNSNTGVVTVSWTAVPAESNGGLPITSYIVTAYQGGSSTSYTCTVSGAAATSCAFTGLPYKTAYTFKVAAVTAAGTGTASTDTEAVTLTRSQTITFTAPSSTAFNTGTVSLSGTASSGLALAYTSNSTSICTVSGAVVTLVTIGTCSITAAQAGDDQYTAATSVTVEFSVTAVVPDAVTLLQVSPGAGKLTVTWSQATALGGSTLKHYIVSWATKTDFSDEQTLTTSSYQNVEIPGLLENTAYIVRIAVVTNDSNENSAWSNKLSATTFGLPAAPTAVTASSSSPGVATVSWTDSASNGGTPITGYTAEAYSVNGSTLTATGLVCSIGSAVGSCTISGLSGATYYKFKVTATNAVGSATSDPSDQLRPGQSQTLSISTVSTTHAAGTVVLDGKSTSGLPVIYAVVSESPTTATSETWGSGRNVCVVDSSGNLTVDLAGTCVISINQDGTDTGNGGSGTSYLPATEVQMTVTVAASKPSVTAELTLTAGNQYIEVNWAAPDNDGGNPVTHYVITWFRKDFARPGSLTENGTDNVAGVTGEYGRTVELASSFTTLYKKIENLVNGTTYTVFVQAVTSAGSSPEN